MTQVSGSISLELGKVVRETANGLLAEAELRLSSIERKLDALTELIRAEADRRDRLINGPSTGEFPTITEEDFRPAVANVGPYEVEVVES